MNHILKKIPVILFILMAAFMVKLDAQAEIIYNTTGEKTPSGEDYYAKYWSGNQWRYYRGDSSNYPSCIDISYDVTYCYEEAYKMIDLVNEQRRKAGVPELQAKDELMDVAMKRAAETAIYWEHIRPDGYSDISSASMFIHGENICAGLSDAKGANNILVNSEGHYKQMINPMYSYVGYGCVKVDDGIFGQGSYYWVQIFSVSNLYYEDGYDAKFHIANDKYIGKELVYCPLSQNDKPVQWDKMTLGNRRDYTAEFTAKVNPKVISLRAKTYEKYLNVGEETQEYVCTYYYNKYKDFAAEIILSSDKYDVKVLTPSICSRSNGKIRALKAGTAKIQYTLKADSSLTTIFEIKIVDSSSKSNNKAKVNDDSGNTYKVNSTKNKTATFYKVSSSATSVTIPKTVKIQGKSYKVTSISAGAFKNNKKLKSVTVGTNVKSIGKDAFSGCGNLKKITIKSTKLQSVGKNALKGVNKKAVIKVPKSKLSSYKKLFKGKGQKKTVQIKKLP